MELPESLALLLSALTGAVWAVYVALRLARLPTIGTGEIVALGILFQVPLMVVLYFLDLPELAAFSSGAVVLTVFGFWREYRRPKMIGTLGTDGYLRLLHQGDKEARVIRRPDDLSGVSRLVVTRQQMHDFSHGIENGETALYRAALQQSIEVVPVARHIMETGGIIIVDETDDLETRLPQRRPFYALYKRLFDIVLSLFLLVLFALPMLLIAVGIRVLDGVPVLFTQPRLGRDGEPFEIKKFRTMEKTESGSLIATRFGLVLRQLHLDELPQIFNILRGEMSLIGPRPEWVLLTTPEEAPENYWLRQWVRPGLTGWAQVNYKPSRTPTMRKRKLGYDLYYIANRSFWLDMLIYLRTAARLPMFLLSILIRRLRERMA